MVGYMSLEEQVDVDFTRARRRAFLRRLMARLRNDPASNGLPCFEDLRKKLGVVGGIRVGRRVVRVEQIVGSVGRSSEFDRIFLPTKASVGERWKRIDRAFHRGEELPPVSLYKVGDSYFVADGNHRVSIARYHGVEWIDAEVTEFHTSVRDEEVALHPGTRPQRQQVRAGEKEAREFEISEEIGSSLTSVASLWPPWRRWSCLVVF